METTVHRVFRSRWWMPAFSVSLGVATLMTALGAVFLFGGRSETISGLGGPGRDERWESIDMRATAATGLLLITVVIGAWLWEIAQGHDGSPYSQLGAVAGIGYILAVAVLRRRS